MASSTPNAEQSKLISDAIKLAMDISTEGVANLSEFLSGITDDVGSMAGKADDQLRKISQERRDEFAVRGGRLANDAISAALEVALAASREAGKDSAQREQNLNALSELVNFFGSMFIDTANKSVGTTAGQPAMSRPRQITVEVAPNGEAKASAWVVNRGADTVTAAPVRVLVADNTGLQFKCEPPEVTIGPRGRSPVTLTVKDIGRETSSFVDALLLVEGVASIVVRTIVKAPEEPSATPAPAPS
jgi:hypothetical protein